MQKKHGVEDVSKKFNRYESCGTPDWDEAENQRSSQIFVTGMHRSGTSLVAMWLNRCGIDFAKDHLSGPRRFNQKGHFEDRRLVMLHNLVIKKHIPKSKGWIVTKDIEFAFSKEHKDMARNLIISYEKSCGVWGWKDPRMAMFLKPWKELIPDMKIVMVWRSADAVVHSLLKRSHRTLSKDAKLNFFEAIQSWKIYNKKILDFCERFPRDTLLLPLDFLIRQDGEIIKLINSKFGVNLKDVPISEVYESPLLTMHESRYLYLYPEVKKISRLLKKNSMMI